MDKEGFISSEKSGGRYCLKGQWLRGQSGLGGEGSVTVRDCHSLRGDVCFSPCPAEQLRMSVCVYVVCVGSHVVLGVRISVCLSVQCVYGCEYV